MRPVNKGEAPRVYEKYGEAKDDLIERLGSCCSYCEMNISNQADVEHVTPKNKAPELELEWDNFLLGCKICNRLKWDYNESREEYIFPDTENTAYLYTYVEGEVKVNKELNKDEYEKAQNLFNLVQLDRAKNSTKAKDDRYRERKNSYEKALESLKDYCAAPIIEMAKQIGRSPEGFFSVWLEVFREYPEVKKEILRNTKGTALECYDEECNPIKRLERKEK